jgi:hypothetical protein
MRLPCQVSDFVSETLIKLESQGEHTAESHVQDKATRFLSIPQSAALEQMVQTNQDPMVSSTTVMRGLELHPDPSPAARISPSKQHLVQRVVSSARARALQPFSQGEKLNGEEGSLTRLFEKIYLRTLVEELNRGGTDLELHQPVCVGHQYKEGVIFGCYSTPMLLLHPSRAINIQWPLLAGFESTFGISTDSAARNSS